jgi:uncharacterized membrane protein
MNHVPEPDPERLAEARSSVQTFLVRKRRLSTALFVAAGFFEMGFGIGMLVCMDWSDRFHWFLLFGFLTVYTPLVIMSWRNAVKMDHLYYRLVDELRYGGQGGQG